MAIIVLDIPQTVTCQYSLTHYDTCVASAVESFVEIH